MKLAGYDHAEDMETLAAADRADARQREIKTGDMWTPRVLAGSMVLAWFSILKSRGRQPRYDKSEDRSYHRVVAVQFFPPEVLR